MSVTPEFGQPIVFTVQCEMCKRRVSTEEAYTIGALGDDVPLCIYCYRDMVVA